MPGQGPTGPQMPGDPRQSSPFPEMSRPIFLSGKVVMEDGTAPPEQVLIERVCHGNHRPEGYTDSKGRFSFQLGQNQHMLADASVSSSADPSFGTAAGGFGTSRTGGGFGSTGRQITERDLMGCEIRASLPGYRSEVVNLSGRRVMDNPDIGTILLRRLGNVEGLTISGTSLQAPKDAKKALDKSRDLVKKKKLAEAQKELEKAVELYPKYAVAWYELGRIQENNAKLDEARKSYQEAVGADSKFVSPYLQLAFMDGRENKWQDVADTTDRVVKLNPFDFPQAFYLNSVANYNLQKFDAAERSARDGLKSDPQHRIPKVAHVLGVILAQKGDFNGAAENMRSYLQWAPLAADADAVKKQLTEVEKRLGKSDAAQKQDQQPK